MQPNEIIEIFSIIQARLTESLPLRFRPVVSEKSLKGKRGALVVGPRGTGKTTFLLKEAAQAKILYISVDHPIVSQITLSDLADAAFGNGYEGIIFDEVHNAHEWGRHIKSIYDSHPRRTVWVSDSSSLILRHTSADLNRRFPKLIMPFLSFREYLVLKHNIKLDIFDPFKAPPKDFMICLEATNILSHFSQYKKEGFRPIFLEGDYHEKILGILEKTIFFDVPFFVPTIQENHLRLMKAIVGFIAASPIPTINVDSLTGQWGVGKEKLYQLLNVMEQVGIINMVRHPKDFSVSGKGAKILFADPSLYSALSGNLGNIREAFTVMIFRQLGKDIFACKDERQGDFIVDDQILEIGGRNKSGKESNYVIKDEIDLPGKRSIPMWSLGMTY